MRQILQVVRCPGLGGVCVTVDQCKGSDNFTACPYYAGTTLNQINCQYKAPPKKVLDPVTKKPFQDRRGNALLPPEFRPKQQNVFTLQIPNGVDLGPEWKNAQINNLENRTKENQSNEA